MKRHILLYLFIIFLSQNELLATKNKKKRNKKKPVVTSTTTASSEPLPFSFKHNDKSELYVYHYALFDEPSELKRLLEKNKSDQLKKAGLRRFFLNVPYNTKNDPNIPDKQDYRGVVLEVSPQGILIGNIVGPGKQKQEKKILIKLTDYQKTYFARTKNWFIT